MTSRRARLSGTPSGIRRGSPPRLPVCERRRFVADFPGDTRTDDGVDDDVFAETAWCAFRVRRLARQDVTRSEPREIQLFMNPRVGGVANVDVIAKLRLIEETLARARRLTSAYRRLVELASPRGLSISPRPGHVDPAVPRRAAPTC